MHEQPTRHLYIVRGNGIASLMFSIHRSSARLAQHPCRNLSEERCPIAGVEVPVILRGSSPCSVRNLLHDRNVKLTLAATDDLAVAFRREYINAQRGLGSLGSAACRTP